jgi:hypothetical protein
MSAILPPVSMELCWVLDGHYCQCFSTSMAPDSQLLSILRSLARHEVLCSLVDAPAISPDDASQQLHG